MQSDPAGARSRRKDPLVGLVAVSVWGVVGVLGFLAAVVVDAVSGDLPDVFETLWSAWLTVLFVLTLASVVAGYWLRRRDHRRQGVGRYVPGPGLEMWVVMQSWSVGGLALAFHVGPGDGDPAWLTVLGAVSVGLGLAAFGDMMRPLATGRGGARTTDEYLEDLARQKRVSDGDKPT